jgi:pilus assembly protein CpaC
VKPVDGNQIALPTDGYKAPNDAERVLLGRLGGSNKDGKRPTPQMAPPVGAEPALGATTPAQPGPQPQPEPVQPVATPGAAAFAQGRHQRQAQARCGSRTGLRIQLIAARNDHVEA